MGRRINAIALVAGLTLAAPAALGQRLADAIPWCDGKFGLCRYIDATSRRELIPARFERAMPFSEGVAAVSIGSATRPASSIAPAS
jgi:hypothetical protein